MRYALLKVFVGYFDKEIAYWGNFVSPEANPQGCDSLPDLVWSAQYPSHGFLGAPPSSPKALGKRLTGCPDLVWSGWLPFGSYDLTWTWPRLARS